mgnify:CR=1 FL=1
MHVNIVNNRWALKVLYNPILTNQSTYIIQTVPSSRTSQPQTTIEINSSIRRNSLIIIRQHLLNDTIATIIESTISSLDHNQILTADIIAQTIQYNQIHPSSQCSICLGDFNIDKNICGCTNNLDLYSCGILIFYFVLWHLGKLICQIYMMKYVLKQTIKSYFPSVGQNLVPKPKNEVEAE